MKNKELEKLAFENPNDFYLGKKIREIIDDIEQEDETDWKDMYLRLSADFDNYRKRVSKEKEELYVTTKTSMLESILDVDSELSIASKYSEDAGVKLITSKLEKFLETQGVKSIQTETYNEELHEVISVVEGNEVKIVNVVAKGYTLGDKIIRYPKVIISK